MADNLGRDDLTAYEQAVALRDFGEAFGLDLETAAGELGLRRRTAYRLKTVLTASEELLAMLAETGASARVEEALVRLERTKPRRAQTLCRSIANGKSTLEQIEAETRELPETPRAAAPASEIEFEADKYGARLKVQVGFDSLANNDERRERVRTAIGRFLGSVEISQVTAIRDEDAA